MYVFWLNLQAILKDAARWIIKIVMSLICYMLLAILSVMQIILVTVFGVISSLINAISGLGILVTTIVAIFGVFNGDIKEDWFDYVISYIVFGLIAVIPQILIQLPILIERLKIFINTTLLRKSS
jgi:hypothetical protein